MVLFTIFPCHFGGSKSNFRWRIAAYFISATGSNDRPLTAAHRLALHIWVFNSFPIFHTCGFLSPLSCPPTSAAPLQAAALLTLDALLQLLAFSSAGSRRKSAGQRSLLVNRLARTQAAWHWVRRLLPIFTVCSLSKSSLPSRLWNLIPWYPLQNRKD